MFFLPLRILTLAHCSPGKASPLLLYACLLVSASVFANTDTTISSGTHTEKTAYISISSLIIQSNTLVQEAISSNANASRFRIDATLYRESLRALMISDSQNNTKTAHSNNAYMELVRMSALLQSAAACKTGRFIVCPIELRQQLLSQQKRLHALSLQKG